MFTTLPPSPLVQIEHHRGFWGIRFNSMVMEAHGAIFFKEKGRAHAARTRARRRRGGGGGGGEGDVGEEEVEGMAGKHQGGTSGGGGRDSFDGHLDSGAGPRFGRWVFKISKV